MLLTHPWPIARPFIAGGVHTISPRFEAFSMDDRKKRVVGFGFYWYEDPLADDDLLQLREAQVVASSGRSDGATQLLLARYIEVVLAQPPAGVLRHANAHRGGPEEIGSEQRPERNATVPRQRTRLEEGHHGERNKADARKDRPTTYPTREHGMRTFICQADQTGGDRLHRSGGVGDVK